MQTANDERSIFLSTAPAAARDRIVAIVVIAMVSVALTACWCSPYREAELARMIRIALDR